MNWKGQKLSELQGHHSDLVNHLAALVEYDYPTRRFAYKLTGTIWAIKDEGGNWRFFTSIY